MFNYPNDGRKLQRLIIAVLKQGLATSINRLNYVKKYTLVAGKLHREEEKILLIKTDEDKKERLLTFLQKQYPDAVLEHITQSSIREIIE
jgi:uncharacterized protein involved in tolerance to divalent cations